MKTVIMVSKCVSVDNKKKLAKFHFKGFIQGQSVMNISLKYDGVIPPVEGIEWLMYVRVDNFKNDILNGTILKAKPITKGWDE